MNYILHQLEESIEQIIQLFNFPQDNCYKMLYKLMVFIIDENYNQEQYQQKSDLLNLIYNLKNNLKQNPYNAVKLFIVQQERKLGDIDEIDLDLHKKCKKEIKELTDKLTKRDQLIKDQTANYTKEMQHLTEQIYRLSNVSENFENHLFDRNQIKDQATLDLINKNFEKISHYYENKMRRLDAIIEAQKKELTTCKSHIKDLKQKYEYHDQPEYLIRKLGQLEKDPYKIWKHFQDFHGNMFLLQVFKHQKNGYGLNYKEIDEILSESKIIERELQQYQRLIDNSLGQFMEKLILHASKEKEMNLQKEMEMSTSITNQQLLTQNIISIYSKCAQSWKRYTNTLLLKYAIHMWKCCDQQGKQTSFKQMIQTLTKVKLEMNNIDFASIYHNQHIQLQSKYNWSQKLNISVQQNLSKLQFQKEHLENLLNNFKQQNVILIDKKPSSSLKVDSNFQKEVIEKIRQYNLEQSHSDEYLNKGKCDQYTQIDEQFVLPLESTPIKIQMQNQWLQSQLQPNNEVKITVFQTESRKEVHSSQRNTVTNFDVFPSKTPQLKTFSQPTSSLDSNVINLKPKFLNLRCEKKSDTQQNENNIQENKVNAILNNQRKYQKVDLLKQMQILNNLQIQLKKIDSFPDQCQQPTQNKGYRSAFKRKPNLSITFEEFNNELIVDPLEIFSSTQRQNKIRRHSTKNSDYLIF